MEINWVGHYNNKLGKISFTEKDFDTFYNETKLFVQKILSFNPKNGIEIGSGLARDSLLLAQRGVKTTAFDIDNDLLEGSKISAENLGVELKTIQGDFFELSNYIKKDEYDIGYHLGVLEHFSDEEIHSILQKQLELIPRIIFTVPIKSDYNDQFFNDTIYRRLMQKEDWQKILKDFNVKDMEIIRMRFDSLIVTIER